MNYMYRLGFVPSYLIWHYSTAIGEVVGVVKNFIWGEMRLFSIGILFKTLFKPWHRLGEEYSKGFDPGEYIGAFITNLLMRLLGMVMRLFVITIGIIIIFLTTVMGVLFLFLWMIMPIFILSLFIHGIIILLQ